MTNADKLKIGLDFHGVITDNPEYFKVFLPTKRCAADMKFMLSVAVRRLRLKSFLWQWGIKYTDIFAIVDYYDARGCVTFYENGEFKVPDKLWNCAKAAYCDENGINIHIDDTMSYSEGFTTPFCFYDVKTRHCRTQDQKVINLEVSPKAALDDIEIFVSESRKK